MEQDEEKENLWQNLWQRPKKFYQRTRQRIRVFLVERSESEEKKEKFYIEEIKKTIESFRFLPKGEQREKFQKTFSLMQDNFIKGEVDNKKCIKHAAHFLKITHTLFLDRKYTYNKELAFGVERVLEFQKKINIAFYNLKNELHGIEKNKESNFLDFLDHEESIKIKDSIFRVIEILSKSIKDIDELNSLDTKKFPIPALEKEVKNYEYNIKSYGVDIDEESKKIRHIIIKNLLEITDKEKIEKLKKSSEIFKSKAKQYRSIAISLMRGAVVISIVIAGLVALSMRYDFFKGENYLEKSSLATINKGGFYVYIILDILLSGRLLLSIIALTGFFYCLRFYAANNHNAIICDQRANTLESFEGLYEHVVEDKEKLLVVEKVINSATEHLPTGFSKQQSDSGGGGIVSSLLSLFKRSSLR